MINGWVGYQKQLARVFGCLSIVLDSEGTEQLEPTPVD
jgi:hypothetical protein